MGETTFLKYPENGEYPRTRDGLVFCELKNGEHKKLLYFNLKGEHKFYDGSDKFYEVKSWSYLQ